MNNITQLHRRRRCDAGDTTQGDGFAPTQIMPGHTYVPEPTPPAKATPPKGWLTQRKAAAQAALSFVAGALLGAGLAASMVLAALGLPPLY